MNILPKKASHTKILAKYKTIYNKLLVEFDRHSRTTATADAVFEDLVSSLRCFLRAVRHRITAGEAARLMGVLLRFVTKATQTPSTARSGVWTLSHLTELSGRAIPDTDVAVAVRYASQLAMTNPDDVTREGAQGVLFFILDTETARAAIIREDCWIPNSFRPQDNNFHGELIRRLVDTKDFKRAVDPKRLEVLAQACCVLIETSNSIYTLNNAITSLDNIADIEDVRQRREPEETRVSLFNSFICQVLMRKYYRVASSVRELILRALVSISYGAGSKTLAEIDAAAWVNDIARLEPTCCCHSKDRFHWMALILNNIVVEQVTEVNQFIIKSPVFVRLVASASTGQSPYGLIYLMESTLDTASSYELEMMRNYRGFEDAVLVYLRSSQYADPPGVGITEKLKNAPMLAPLLLRAKPRASLP